MNKKIKRNIKKIFTMAFVIVSCVTMLSVSVSAGNNIVDLSRIEGWAAISGDGLDTTTGGVGGETVTVTTLEEFMAVSEGDEPRTIIIDGTITCKDTGVPLGSNKTVVGADEDATIHGAIYMKNVSNIIISNLNFQGFYPNPGPDDCISARNVHHLWLDHLSLWDAGDGLMDITIGSNYVTVSWCKFYYTDLSNGHRLCSLIGSGADHDDTDMNKNKATYHHNWFAEGVDQRMPRILYGQGHVYNNYYTCKDNSYCVGVGCYASVLIENNYFKDVNSPHEIMYTHARPAYITAEGNIYDNTNGKKDTGLGGGEHGNVEAFTNPPYEYNLDDAKQIPDIVTNGAGPRNLDEINNSNQNNSQTEEQNKDNNQQTEQNGAQNQDDNQQGEQNGEINKDNNQQGEQNGEMNQEGNQQEDQNSEMNQEGNQQEEQNVEMNQDDNQQEEQNDEMSQGNGNQEDNNEQNQPAQDNVDDTPQTGDAATITIMGIILVVSGIAVFKVRKNKVY